MSLGLAVVGLLNKEMNQGAAGNYEFVLGLLQFWQMNCQSGIGSGVAGRALSDLAHNFKATCCGDSVTTRGAGRAKQVTVRVTVTATVTDPGTNRIEAKCSSH